LFLKDEFAGIPAVIYPVCVLILLTLLVAGCEILIEKEKHAGSAGAFYTGNYRNLFVEAGYSPQEVTERINDVFEQLFHGDPNSQAVYFAAGGNENGQLAYIYDIYNNDVRSEGMSYGMMIAVQLDKKVEFDAIWNWARTYMYHDDPNHPAYGYFSWSMRTDGTSNDEMPAPDGEEYFATALYFASGHWGNGNGIYNYRSEADRILGDMKNRGSISGQTSRGPRNACEVFNPEYKMVRFTPIVENHDYTDPSYHLPAFYELWAMWGPQADRAFWEQAAAVSRDFFQCAAHPVTGLTPEYANFDGTPWTGRQNSNSGDFRFDAWRTVMNWSMDWAWWARDVHERQLSDRLQAFFESKGMSDYGNQFKLNGEQLGSDHSPGLVAMNAVASLAATHECAKQFVQALWNTPIPSGRYRYYDDMLYLLGMLNCSGRYRIWPPQ